MKEQQLSIEPIKERVNIARQMVEKLSNELKRITKDLSDWKAYLEHAKKEEET